MASDMYRAYIRDTFHTRHNSDLSIRYGICEHKEKVARVLINEETIIRLHRSYMMYSYIERLHICNRSKKNSLIKFTVNNS